MAIHIIYSLNKSSAKLLSLFSFRLTTSLIIEMPAVYLRTSQPAYVTTCVRHNLRCMARKLSHSVRISKEDLTNIRRNTVENYCSYICLRGKLLDVCHSISKLVAN